MVSIGLGRVQRGFERYFTDLFHVLRGELDVTLFKSREAVLPCEKIPAMLGPATAMARSLPLGKLAGSKEYNRDCLAFGLTLLPELLRNRFDIVHCIDPPLAHALVRLQRIFRLRSRVLFTEGCAMPTKYYPPVAHIHHVAPLPFGTAQAEGIPAHRMTLIPCGIHPRRFVASLTRTELRKKYLISESTFVVLAVSAVKRDHKRVDHIIDEMAKVPGDVLLWIDGNPEDPLVPEMARRRLGSKCRITHVPSTDIAELYRVSDVLVHASLTEAFGLVLVEAASAGLMVLAHDSPHFEWLLQDRECLVDMASPGSLAARLNGFMQDREAASRNNSMRADQIRRRFDWEQLQSEYIAMYHKLTYSDATLAALPLQQRAS